MKAQVAPLQAAFSTGDEPMDPVLEFIDRVGQAYDLPPEPLTDLRIALDEVVTNIAKYAYAEEGRHEFTIRCEVREGRLQTVVEDGGVAFDPLNAPAPDLSLGLEQRPIGGLGVHFVKKLMSAVRYERVGARNRLTMEQELNKQKGNV